MPRHAVVALMLLAAGAVYASCLDYFFFGRVGDDSRHWLAALSILQGRYVDLAHPEFKNLAIPPPGYPILLLPFAALDWIRGAQWFNVACLVAGAWVVLRLLRREPALALAAAALTAFNPLTVLQASPLMADPAFYFVSFAALAAAAGVLERPERAQGRVVAAALLAAASSWIRPQGVTVLGAAGLALLESPATRRLAWRYLAVGAPLAVFPHAWIVLRSDPTVTYFTHLTTTSWRQESVALEVARTVLLNLRFYAAAATTRAPLNWVAPVPGETSWAAFAVMAAGLALLGVQLKRALAERGLPRLLVYYLVSYLGLHLFWSNQFRRYLFPILPILYWLALRPLASRPRALTGVAMGLLAYFCAFDGVLAWHAHAIRPNENAPPEQTIAFVREHTRPGDVLAARYRETFAWHTSRFAIDVGFHPDPDEWFHELARHNVRYVVNHPEGETMESVRRDRLRASSGLILERLEDPSRFRFAFRAEGEPFTVHELLGAEAFERGYVHLAKFHEALAADDLAGARAALEEARKTGAAITRLPFYLGTTELLLGRAREARRWLEEAARREPSFAPARRNLERVLQK